ncbi:MAG: hypothetical protein ACK5H2_11515 [Beutenbergiaceae bacterium]
MIAYPRPGPLNSALGIFSAVKFLLSAGSSIMLMVAVLALIAAQIRRRQGSDLAGVRG